MYFVNIEKSAAAVCNSACILFRMLLSVKPEIADIIVHKFPDERIPCGKLPCLVRFAAVGKALEPCAVDHTAGVHAAWAVSLTKA